MSFALLSRQGSAHALGGAQQSRAARPKRLSLGDSLGRGGEQRIRRLVACGGDSLGDRDAMGHEVEGLHMKRQRLDGRERFAMSHALGRERGQVSDGAAARKQVRQVEQALQICRLLLGGRIRRVFCGHRKLRCRRSRVRRESERRRLRHPSNRPNATRRLTLTAG